TLAQPSNADVKVDTDTTTTGEQTTLTFTTSDWNTAQAVTISAAEDGDTDNDSASISVTASGGGYDEATGMVSVDVTDNDAGNLTLPSNSVAVTEGGTATFAVQLSAQPTGNVTVTLTQPSNADVKVDTDSTTAGNQNTLTFTASNWNTAQTVTISAEEDGDTTDETASISVSATGGGYQDATGTVSVDVTDNDTAGMTVSTNTLGVDENASATFTVQLNTQPSGNVSVTVAQTGTANPDVTVNPTALTFTTSNWGTPQTVTVSAAEDDDALDESANLSLSASGGGYDDVDDRSVRVDVTDDDDPTGELPPPALDISRATVAIDEGSSGTFTVRLTRQPSGSVTVSMAQPANADITLDRTALTFTASNWNTAQEVRVSAADDDDAADESASITLTASGAEYRDVTATVSITVNDDDGAPPSTARSFAVSNDPVLVDEGSSTVFSVKLTVIPLSDVTVVVGRPSNSDVTTTPERLVFTPSNWSATQAVTVFAAQDDDAEDDKANILLRASGGGYDGATRNVAISVNDDDLYLLGLVLSARNLTLDEGSDQTFTVRLKSRPSADVKVNFQQSSNGDVTVDTERTVFGKQSTLTFTPSNWKSPRTVVVSAIRDGDAIDDHADISLHASGGGYNGIIDSISVAVIDNDASPGLVLSPSKSLTVTEGGSGTFTVRLTQMPSADVIVTLTPPASTDVNVDTDPGRDGNQNRLVFTPSNWYQVQAVIVSADRDRDNIDERTSVSIAA
ncbi:hypothetical protein, partial [Thioalkalivibrio sp. HK1]|uniref:hypothetical protein n=1 Tax=Thioalkalivibrio sp. HK1 TaxID=1469245 RepID=UPI00046EBAC5